MPTLMTDIQAFEYLETLTMLLTDSFTKEEKDDLEVIEVI